MEMMPLFEEPVKKEISLHQMTFSKKVISHQLWGFENDTLEGGKKTSCWPGTVSVLAIPLDFYLEYS